MSSQRLRRTSLSQSQLRSLSRNTLTRKEKTRAYQSTASKSSTFQSSYSSNTLRGQFVQGKKISDHESTNTNPNLANARLHAVHYITTKSFLKADNSPIFTFLFNIRVMNSLNYANNSNVGSAKMSAVGNSSSMALKAIRQSLSRFSKIKARITLGKGQLIITTFNTHVDDGDVKENLVFEIGSLLSVDYPKISSRTFSLCFLGAENKLFEFRADNNLDALDFLEELCAEISCQAQIFETAAEQLRSKGTKYVNQVEALLRESADMWSLCRGDSHPDCIKAERALAIFLEGQDRLMESQTWYDRVSRKTTKYETQRRKEMEVESSEVERELDEKLTGFEQVQRLAMKHNKERIPRDVRTRVENLLQVVEKGVGIKGLPSKVNMDEEI